MDRIERITKMEQALDESAAAVAALLEAVEKYRAAVPQMKELEAYYQSEEWLSDYDADSAGELPQDLKRGVLSEDGVWDMLSDNTRLWDEIEELARECGEG